ncbi:MAG: hypothetical protein M1826_004001 [Phylliscum demangeonii]|nr:MAG: hypothetical protein M1826_004001 [Phylliscum demangeonii]
MIGISVAEPEGGWKALLPEQGISPAPLPVHLPRDGSAATGEDVQNAGSDDLDRWIDEMVRLGQHPEADVIFALKCTSMDTGRAEHVLDHFLAVRPRRQQRRGSTEDEGDVRETLLPQDQAGIWTRADDAVLQRGDGPRMAALERKHGSVAMENRLRFLQGWQAAD